MKCDTVQELLSPYIDEMTGVKETEAIKQHLDGCTGCQSDYAALLSLRQKLREMPAPTVPEGFMSDFSGRLSQEQERLVDFQKERALTFRKPSWVGWIAASAAAVALAAGVYMSSYLPTALQVAHQDQSATSSLTVDEIIASLELNPVESPKVADNINPFVPNNLGPDYSEPPYYSVADNSDDGEPAPGPDASTEPTEPAAVDTADQNDAVVSVASADDYITQHFYSSTKVASIPDSIKQIENLARAQGVEYKVPGSEESSLMTVATADDNQSIVLQVPPDKVEQVLKDLAAQGVEEPVMNEVDYSAQYNDINKELQKVGQSIEELGKNPKLSPDQQKELQVLQNNQEILENQQQLIESQAEQVQIEVNFNTGINP